MPWRATSASRRKPGSASGGSYIYADMCQLVDLVGTRLCRDIPTGAHGGRQGRCASVHQRSCRSPSWALHRRYRDGRRLAVPARHEAQCAPSSTDSPGSPGRARRLASDVRSGPGKAPAFLESGRQFQGRSRCESPSPRPVQPLEGAVLSASCLARLRASATRWLAPRVAPASIHDAGSNVACVVPRGAPGRRLTSTLFLRGGAASPCGDA